MDSVARSRENLRSGQESDCLVQTLGREQCSSLNDTGENHSRNLFAAKIQCEEEVERESSVLQFLARQEV